MTSWALVCDVYFLPPQTLLPNEDSAAFAARVQRLIAKWAHLRIVPWDGYLKYYNLGKKVNLIFLILILIMTFRIHIWWRQEGNQQQIH